MSPCSASGLGPAYSHSHSPCEPSGLGSFYSYVTLGSGLLDGKGFPVPGREGEETRDKNVDPRNAQPGVSAAPSAFHLGCHKDHPWCCEVCTLQDTKQGQRNWSGCLPLFGFLDDLGIRLAYSHSSAPGSFWILFSKAVYRYGYHQPVHHLQPRPTAGACSRQAMPYFPALILI